MDYLQQSFSVRFEYKVFFTEHLFEKNNGAFKAFLDSQRTDTIKKIFIVLDDGVAIHHPRLENDINEYFVEIGGYSLVRSFMRIEGGENAKNSKTVFYQLIDAINMYGIDRHSYIIAIGGGSVLDLVGYAAAVSHRGIRHIRVPTTVLSQNDSGVGVKNGMNYATKKNFLGTFAPPAAVFNDFHFLTTLSLEEWRSGISEAVKVALIKDKGFFTWLQQNAKKLAGRDMQAMQHLIKQCAKMHLDHIASGDPFEMGSSRPLDFGHWSAHKLEQISHFSVRHGEAVAFGIALDSAYSYVSGRITESDALQIIALLRDIGFSITHPMMDISNESSDILKGLDEFREHLGGKLTIMLLTAIGKGEEVNELSTGHLIEAYKWLNASS